MNKFISNSLLTGHKFSQNCIAIACGLFTKHRERIQKFRETGNLKHLYRNELEKVCFAYDAAYSDSKDLAKITISNNILRDRAYEIPRNRNYDGYQRALVSMIRKQDRE